MTRIKIGNAVPRIMPIVSLIALLQDEDDDRGSGALVDIEKECTVVIDEVAAISKEVGGDVQQSPRWRYAIALRGMIQDMRRLLEGNHDATTTLVDKLRP